MEKLNLKTIERMSIKNICIMLNIEYESAKQLKKIDIIYMINNGLSIDEIVQFKHKQIQDQLDQLKTKKVKLSDEELKQKRKEKAKVYFQTSQGKLSLQKAQKSTMLKDEKNYYLNYHCRGKTNSAKYFCHKYFYNRI